MKSVITEILCDLYGEAAGTAAAQDLDAVLRDRIKTMTPPDFRGEGSLPLDEKDAFLITYGDQMQSPGKPPLKVLDEFAGAYLQGCFSGIHVLPFFPYTSDDGFSISDYRAIYPGWGDWEDMRRLGRGRKLMSDLVLNHCSASHDWFKRFLAGEEPYTRYFITESPDTDLSGVARPRALPLLTPFETDRGTQHVWTTFSADQVDLNFGNPQVLIELIDVFLFHVKQGIQVIRLDAIAYLWKEVGHSSIHHPKTHLVVKLFRKIIDEFLPWVVLLTETNVPHQDNISYFGNGDDEAHMVYQFALPPLTLDAFLREDPGYLKAWASRLPQPDGRTTYFNFLASHDGVGLLPSHGILSDQERDNLIDSVKARGGLISYKATADGKIPYEMNVNYLSAVAEDSLPVDLRAKKFLASQGVILSLPGVPGVYVHSFLGSENWPEGVDETGMNRTINRRKFDYRRLTEELQEEGSLRNRVVKGYTRMLEVRRREKAFHPAGGMEILDGHPQVLALVRTPPGIQGRKLLCLINFSGKSVEFPLPSPWAEGAGEDLLSGQPLPVQKSGSPAMVGLDPFDVRWIALGSR